MEYRVLGRTGLRVSEIGMGCEGFVDKPYEEVLALVDAMEAGGINIVDLYTPDPSVRSHLGRALRGRREKFILQAHLCTIWKDGQYKRTRAMEEVRAGFTDQLERLETDHVEIGMIHYADTRADWEKILTGGVMDYAKELKAAGVIRHIGLSSHSAEVSLAAVEARLIDVLMFSVNPCYDLLPGDRDIEALGAVESYQAPLLNMDPQRQALYETCQRLGVGITVMKAFGGGDLLSDLGPAGMALTVDQCLHYALTRPAVASVLAGAKTGEELARSLAYETASPEERDYAAALAALPKISWKGHCMYCGHCAPCPQGIDVAAVTKFLNLCRAQGSIPETVREHYAALAHKAGECIACGACEKRCPFAVPAVENMKAAAGLFGC